MSDEIRYLLLQVRSPGGDMRENEVQCFSRALAILIIDSCPIPVELREWPVRGA